MAVSRDNSGKQMTNVAHRLPAPQLRPHIARYGGFRIDGRSLGIVRGLPSRHITLMIGLGAPFVISSAGTFTSFVAGLHGSAGTGTVYSSGLIEGVHVFLRPSGVSAILNVSTGALTGCVVHVKDLMGSVSQELHERLRAARGWSQRFDILDEIFTRMLTGRKVAANLGWAWDQIVGAAGSTCIRDLAREMQWDRRHFTQRFGAEFGVTPKRLARIVRFEEACALIRCGRGRLVDVALSAGYHDQSHMTHEWVALANCTPKVWIREELPFVQDYELAALEN
jgi:AraC-like DNA-binding protein